MPYWTHPEEMNLIHMVEEGRGIEELSEIFKRSPEAIRLKLRRLGFALPEKSKVTTGSTTTLPEIKPAKELISMEEMLKLLLGSLEQLRNPGVSAAEIKRCRTIVSTARNYMNMLRTFEKMSELEQWLVNSQNKMVELTKRQLQDTKDPAERQRLEREIAHMQEFIEKSPYKPFQKKPSLIAPTMPGGYS